MAAKFIRAANIPFNIGEGQIIGIIDSAGVPPYGWSTPDGPPNTIPWVLSSAYIRQRMTVVQGLAENWWGTGEWNPFANLPSSPTYTQLLSRWEIPLFGQSRPF